MNEFELSIMETPQALPVAMSKRSPLAQDIGEANTKEGSMRDKKAIVDIVFFIYYMALYSHF